MKYDHKKVEKKWQDKWSKEGLYTPSIKSSKNPYYNLYMFPYPSAEGLHAGHAFSSTGSDIHGRFMRMQERDVFQPIGYDSFGIHSENYAITTKEHPSKMLARTTKYYEKQMRMLGHGYDWTRIVTTSDIDYYRWTQWLFTEMFKAGLAYRQKASVNWCPSCKTVLADEQVISDMCERCGTKVEVKELEQWFFRITDYADKLLGNLDKIDWSQRVVTAQRNWIGKSMGAVLRFRVSGGKDYIDSFTTRPDTLYGATFFVLSPEHPQLENITASKYKKEVQEYVNKAKAKSTQDGIADKSGKTGVFTGGSVINPATNKKIPVYVADYVLMDYGTGAIMGVPAHDERDFEFAKQYDLPIKPVIVPTREYVDENAERYYKKRSKLHKEVLIKLANKAHKAKKRLMVLGGWAVYLQTGKEFRDFEDLDIAILEDDLEWWRKTLKDDGMEIKNMFPDGKNDKYYFQAVKKDLHIDIGAIRIDKDNIVTWLAEDPPKKSDMFEKIFEKKTLDNMPLYVMNKDVLYYNKKKHSGDLRWKEQADYLFMGFETYDGEGQLINSGKWDGIKVPQSMDKVIKDVEKQGWGKAETTYHLRDWLISRQRYWGPPIPMIYCESCAKEDKSWLTLQGESFQGIQSDYSDWPASKASHSDAGWEHAGWYPEESLPVELPIVKKYQPEGKGRGPLEDHPAFYKTKCPHCGGSAKRETDVSDTFLDSSWYFLRYPSVDSESASKKPFDPAVTKKWLPVSLYFGGAEHSVLHLMYARFVTMVLNDLGHIDFDEPFPKFYAHGLMIKDGAKMSKSRGNVVNPDEYMEKFGADALRLYLVFIGPMDQSPDFRDAGMEGMYRFLMRVWNLYQNYSDLVLTDIKDAEEVLITMHQTIRKVSKDMQNFRYNTAISSIMEFVNLLKTKTNAKHKKAKGNIKCAEWEEALVVLAKLLAPFAPHVTEEIWATVLDRKSSIHTSNWPKFDPKLVVEENVEIVIQVNGKLRGQLIIDTKNAEDNGKVIAEAKRNKKVTKYLEGKKVSNTIFVPGKLINFVTD